MGGIRISLGLALALWALPAVAGAQCSTEDLDMDGVPDVCPPGSNYIEGSGFIFGTGGDDCIFVVGGGSLIFALGGADYICGGDGDDVVFGGGGADSIFGQGGDDFVSAGGGDDIVNGGDGNDTLNGGAGNDSLSGEAGDDDLFGGAGDDLLSGGAGTDTLDGGGGTNGCVEEVPGTEERLTNCAQTTFVSLSRVRLLSRSGVPTLAWDTTTEVGAVSFRVWRVEASGDLSFVDEVRASLTGDPRGASYFVRDEGADLGGLEYVIEERTIDGGSVRYGPFAPGFESARASDRWMSLRSRVGRQAAPSAHVRFERPNVFETTTKAMSEPAGAELVIDREGLYEVTAESIAAALGASVEDIRARIETGKLRLTLADREIAWHSVEAGAAMRFVSTRVLTPFATERRYLVTLDEGATMGRETLAAATPGEGAHAFDTTLHLEENVFAGPSGNPDPSQDLFFWHALAEGDEVSISVPLEHLIDANQGEVRVTLHGATLHPEQPHRVQLAWNGTVLGTADTFGQARHTISFPLEGFEGFAENQLVLRVLPSGDALPIVFIDHVEVDYVREAVVDAPHFRFATDANGRIALEGLGSSRVALYDMGSEELPSYLGDFEVDETGRLTGKFGFASRPFLAAPIDEVHAPVGVTPHLAPRLRDAERGADYLVITPSFLLDAVRPLADYREADGYETDVVDLDDVYWAFAGGEPDPRAVRNFLAYARAEWDPAPRYVLLVGKGSNDYRDLQGLGGNWVPPLLAPTGGGLAPSDSIFGDVEGDDGVPEIAVGRLPITEPEELDPILESIQTFEGRALGKLAPAFLFAADYGDCVPVAGNCDDEQRPAEDIEDEEFLAAAKRLAATVPGEAPEVLTWSDNPAAVRDARAQLTDAWSHPLDWMTYVGHAGLDRLSDDGVLTSEDVPLLSEGEASPVLVGWSCNFGRFDVPGFISFGERIVTQGAGAAVLSATGWSNHIQTDVLRTSFHESAFSSDAETLGEALLHAHRSAKAAPIELHRAYTLLGDPALRLRLPKAELPPAPTRRPDSAPSPSTSPELADRGGSGGGCSLSSARASWTSVLLIGLLLWLTRARRRRRVH